MVRKAPASKKSRISLERTVDSMIVHDMKNLTFRLSALLQNLEHNYDDPLFKQSMTDLLEDTIFKMNHIVKNFADHKEQVIVKLRVDLNNLLSGIVNSLPDRVIRNIQIATRFNEVPAIWGDAYYLHNAFQSIVENALEAMPKGGNLEIGTSVVEKRKNKFVSAEISDTGVGISPAFLREKLFQPFATTKEKGLGLGLFTCRQIVALHDGQVSVNSRPGEGTTFRFFFPVE